MMGYLRSAAALSLISPGLVMGVVPAAAQSVPQAVIHRPELIVYDGKIVTMSDTSYSTTLGRTVEAMAVRGDEILALGTDAEILPLAGPETRKIDLQGRTVIPGIINAHTHVHDNVGLTPWTRQWMQNPAESPVAVFEIEGSTHDEVRRNIEVTLRERTSRLRPRQWIHLNLPGRDFIGTYFIQDKGLTQAELSQLMADHPVIVNGHPAYVWNDAAVARLEELYGARHPEEETNEEVFGSRIIEFRRLSLVDDYFAHRVDELADIVKDALLKTGATGVTTFSSHITGLRFMDAYMQLVRKDRMPIRFAYGHHMGALVNPGFELFAARMGDMAGLGDDYFWQAAITASVLDSGPPMICTSIDAPEDIKKREWCRAEDGMKFRNFVYNGLRNRVRLVVGHNYGDLSADHYMDMLDDLLEEGFSLDYIRSRRLTMDHCGLYPRPDQLPRMKKFNIYLSCGSNVLTRSWPWVEKYGLEHQHWVAPVKTALDAGVKVVFETEGYVDNGLFSAFVPFITRVNRNGQVVSAKNAVDRNIVMKMATSWGAEFVIREDKVGTLEVGKWADFLVLNKDYFTVPVKEIARVYPIMTVVGGKIRYVRSDQAEALGLEPVGIQVRYRWEQGAAGADAG